MCNPIDGEESDGPSLRLRPPRPDDEDAVRDAQRLLQHDGMAFANRWDEGMSWESYLTQLERWRHGVDLPDDWVASTLLLAEVGGEVVGRTLIRHELNDFLARWGGHIGYGVVPAHRGRGYATEILRQSLVVARSLGLGRVLLTCYEDNPASARVIARCGGVLESTPALEDGTQVRRYWIG